MKSHRFLLALLLAVSMPLLADDNAGSDDPGIDDCIWVELSDGSVYLECDPIEVDSVRSRGNGGRF